MEFSSRYRPIFLLIFTLVILQSSTLLAQNGDHNNLVATRAPSIYIIGKMALIPFSSKQTLSLEQSEESLSDIERFMTISLYDALVLQTSGMVDVEILPLKKSDTEFAKLRDGACATTKLLLSPFCASSVELCRITSVNMRRNIGLYRLENSICL